jgi:putative cardiolipin synthase
LHAKLVVFDRRRVFVGSMNFDQRSFHLNTEIGLLIDSPELAREIGHRFDAVTQPANSYALILSDTDAFGRRKIRWSGDVDGQIVVLDEEPAVDAWRRLTVDFMALFPIEGQL